MVFKFYFKNSITSRKFDDGMSKQKANFIAGKMSGKTFIFGTPAFV